MVIEKPYTCLIKDNTAIFNSWQSLEGTKIKV
jgi:hypothetical protein